MLYRLYSNAKVLMNINPLVEGYMTEFLPCPLLASVKVLKVRMFKRTSQY